MSDDFFDDEQELMEAEGADAEASGKPARKHRGKGKGAGRKAADAEDGAAGAPEGDDADDAPAADDDVSAEPEVDAPAPVRQGPPFWMVLAIAVIALLLGVVIGYLVGTQATLAEISSASSQAQSAGTSTSGTSGDTSVELPEGHPKLTENADGTWTAEGSGSSSAASGSSAQ